MESFNARDLSESSLGEKVDITVCDVSFISQKYIYPAVTSILKEGGIFISLIKPQFEAGREHLSKKGIVKDVKVHKRVIESCISEAAGLGLVCKGVIPSPICGGDGNTEYLAVFGYTGDTSDLRIEALMPEGI
jgi:23S rRNA (cytidine1920-2'-O)/16S rRNA (cytidine1409-2'-O)-methyltransferase